MIRSGFGWHTEMPSSFPDSHLPLVRPIMQLEARYTVAWRWPPNKQVFLAVSREMARRVRIGRFSRSSLNLGWFHFRLWKNMNRLETSRFSPVTSVKWADRCSWRGIRAQRIRRMLRTEWVETLKISQRVAFAPASRPCALWVDLKPGEHLQFRLVFTVKTV